MVKLVLKLHYQCLRVMKLLFRIQKVTKGSFKVVEQVYGFHHRNLEVVKLVVGIHYGI